MDSSIPANPPTTIAPPPVPQLREASFFFADMDKPGCLLVCNEAQLPEVCLITGEATGISDWRKRRQITWSPPWVFLGLFGGVLPLLILILVTQKKAHITYSLSPSATRQINRKRGIAVGLLLTAIGLIALAIANADDTAGTLILIAIPLLITSLIFLIVVDPIKPIGHKNGWFRVKGVSKSFLDTLEQRRLGA